MNEQDIKIVQGNTIKGFAGAWYRHDRIIYNGIELDGFIQVRKRFMGKRFGHRIAGQSKVQNRGNYLF